MSTDPTVAAAVLAAGRSSRMGHPKALLRLGAATFLERVVSAAERARLEPLRVVVGAHRREIDLAMPWLRPRFVVNDDVDQGQLHSLRLALRTLSQDCDACVMMLVDHPLVCPSTVRALVDAYAAYRPAMVVPRFRERRGHPVLFSHEMFDPLCNGPLEGGARRIVREQGVSPLAVDVEDPGVLTDVDTPEEYEQALNGFRS